MKKKTRKNLDRYNVKDSKNCNEFFVSGQSHSTYLKSVCVMKYKIVFKRSEHIANMIIVDCKYIYIVILEKSNGMEYVETR